MSMSRPARLTLACFVASALVGLAATINLVLSGDATVRAPSTGVALAGALVAAATVANLLLRFVRWHWLLRRLELRLPTIDSLGAYIGSYAFLPIPVYLGQLLARWRLLGAAQGQHGAAVITATVLERVADVWAVALLASLGLPRWRLPVVVGLAALPFVPALRRTLLALVERAAQQVLRLITDPAATAAPPRLRHDVAPAHVATMALLSLGAWATTTIALVGLAWTAGIGADFLPVQAAAARSVLLGGLSLLPLGASVGGIVLLRGLEALGATPDTAGQVTFVFRASTAWLTVVLGALSLWLVLRRRGQPTAHDHFDAIDECYDTWLPEHYRTHLVTRKTGPVIARLGELPANPRGLDIGCGRGWYLGELRAAGAQMIGLDYSGRQLAAAMEHTAGAVPFVQATVMRLPFAPASFDFAYIINVLHHLPSPAHQREALQEIARVVRPGGLVFVHEMSMRNPLFRIYLSYVFPLVKGIEEGTEYYLDPERMRDLRELHLREVHHFTFVPDFVPAAMLPSLAAIERKLEASRFAPWAAHFLAVYQRRPDGAQKP